MRCGQLQSGRSSDGTLCHSGRAGGNSAGNRLLDTLEGKTIFGEMALVDGAPRSATAVAMTDVTLVPVSEKQFLYLVSQTPFFALKVMRVLARRLRASNKVM